MKKTILSIIAIIGFAITTMAQVTATISSGGPTTFCTGNNVQLSSTIVPASVYQYQWMKDGNNISGANASSYTASISGSYVLKTTALNSLVYNSNAITVTVNSLPTAPNITYNSPAIICNGGSISLKDNSSTNVSYQWYRNNTPINNATTNTYSATTGGNYKLIITNLTTGCSNTSQNVSVGEMPQIVDNNIVTFGTSTTISLTNPNFNYSTLPSTCNVNMSGASIVDTNVGGSGGGSQRKIICYGGNLTINGSGGNTFVVEYGGTLNGFGGGGGNTAYVKAGGIYNYNSGGGGGNVVYYETGAIINGGSTQLVNCNNIGVIYPSNTTNLCNNLTYLWSNGETTPTITVNPTQPTTYSVKVSYGGVSCTDQVLVSPVSNINTECWNQISNGSGHTIAIKNDGTLWSWGSNYYGELGNGTLVQNIIPTQIGTENNWSYISCGNGVNLALKSNGTLWAWGNNEFGQLGIGNNNNSNIPIQVGTSSDWLTVSIMESHSLGIKTNGTLWAWGNNAYGELGDSSLINKKNPVQIGSETNWQQISAGAYHSIAKKNDGTIWTWGNNFGGQLGDGTTVSKSYPIKIISLNNSKSIIAGGIHNLIIKNDNTLWGWGTNRYGQIGDDSNSDRLIPVQVGLDADWKTISAGTHHSIAIKNNGTLWGWGRNETYQLGDNGVVNKSIPTQIGLLNSWSKITAGFSVTLGVLLDNSLWGWGGNFNGEIGDGTINEKKNPTQIYCNQLLGLTSLNNINTITVYPNPAHTNITIDFGNFIILNGYTIKINNSLGQQVYAGSINQQSSNIDVTTLSGAGIYYLSIIDPQSNIVAVRKIVLQ